MGMLSKSRTVYQIARNNAKGWPAFVWNTGMSQMHRAWPLMPPIHVAIEPTNACNAKCPVCETGKNEMSRRKGMLDKQAYETFIDSVAKTTNSLLFYFMGEPFLNKHAYEMIHFTRSKGIYVETCTNGDYVDPEGVVFSDINKISFQLGGMSEDTHQRYRVGSSLEKAQRNLEALIKQRNRHPESHVQVEVGFIVMRHNEHEVPAFLKWAEEIGVDIANVVDPCVRNMFEAYAYLPESKDYWYYDEEAFEQGVLKPKVLPDNECVWVWNSIQINWNGDAVPCCRDPNGTHVMGNVFDDGLLRVFNGQKAVDFRRQILGNQGSVSICQLCSGYGMPTMHREKPSKFSVVRHTSSPDLHSEIAAASKEALAR